MIASVDDEEPAEHLRFAKHLRSLDQATEDDEAMVVASVLTDPDEAMAQSAVARHWESRVADLLHDPGYAPWHQAMADAVAGRSFLTARLADYSLFRAVILDAQWSAESLIEGSAWLQRLVSAHPQANRAHEILAKAGRTHRIRATARTNLTRNHSTQDET